jgi:acetyl-CoA carboxylase alpha subunit
MDELAEKFYHALAPYVDELVEAVVRGYAELENASFEAFLNLVCSEAEVTVRKLVKLLNQKAREGKLQELREVIQRNPEAARKASKYVARRLKYRIRKVIESMLSEPAKPVF